MKQTITLAVIIMLLCLSTVSASGAQAEAKLTDNHLQGVWLWRDIDYKEKLNVVIVREDSEWSATIDDESVKVDHKNGELSFLLPNGQSFNGKLQVNNEIEGTWLQPPMGYGSYTDIATTVSLPPASKNMWKGIIQLQPITFHLFLDIFKGQDGKTQAVLRNPEVNEILGATLFEVRYLNNENDTQNWQLYAKRSNREITVPFTYLANQTITLEHFHISGPAILQRANTNELSKYYSRMPVDGDIKPTAIKDLNDGWEIAEATEMGFDQDLLNSLITKLATADPRARRPQLLHSLLVSIQGKLVLEEYFYGHSSDTVHDSRSLGKVFGSVLIGAAQLQGFDIQPSDHPLPDILSDAGLEVPDEKSIITLEHFLTYTSGLDASEDSQSKGSEEILWQQQQQSFWLYTANLDVLHPPGKRYAYASASANIVGSALEKVTGKPLRTFFDETIAKPMRFAPYHWNLTHQGKSYLGGGVHMRPRDMLKIGALYAAKGKWHGKQIVPKQWVSLSTQAKIAITPETTGLSEEAFSNNYGRGSRQAYIWLVNTISAGNKQYDSYAATGNGGQVIVVVPELELAVGFTGGNYRMGGIWGRWSQQIIGGYLIPALEKQR